MAHISRQHAYVVELDEGAPRRMNVSEAARAHWNIEDVATERTHDIRIIGHTPDGALIVEVNGRRRRLHVECEDGEARIRDAGRTARARAFSAGEIRLGTPAARRTKERAPQCDVTSPITGIVLNIEVEPGTYVEQGEPLCVVEAMKMENTIFAARDGVVQRIDVARGDTVFVGDCLVCLADRDVARTASSSARAAR